MHPTSGLRLRLRHLHLPSIHPHYIPYSLADRVQEHLRRRHLDLKDGDGRRESPVEDAAASPQPQPQPPPLPTLISFTPSPIYTLGRRQTAPLTPAETARLTAPLTIFPPHQHSSRNLSSSSSSSSSPSSSSSSSSPSSLSTPSSTTLRPTVRHAPRGGLTTYHGPGQVVLWPVLDLRSRHHANYTVRCYARLLEGTTIAALRALFGLRGLTTADPGVWVSDRHPVAGNGIGDRDGDGDRLSVSEDVGGSKPDDAASCDSSSGGAGDGDGGPGRIAKIAALGVHLRRHVTALGTAVNVAFPEADESASGPAAVENGVPKIGGEEAWNPWARIVACGLEGKRVTSVAAQLGGAGRVDEMLLARSGPGPGPGPGPGTVERAGFALGGREGMVAQAWAEELARRIGLEGVEVVDQEEVIQLMEGLVRGAGEHGHGDAVKEVEEEERAYLERMREMLRGR